jgi:hypothetical protein
MKRKSFEYILTNGYRLRLINDGHDLLSERAPQRDKTATFRQEAISGHKSQSGLETMAY